MRYAISSSVKAPSRYALSEKVGRRAHVCLRFGQFWEQTQAHLPAFVPFPPRLFPFQRVQKHLEQKKIGADALSHFRPPKP